MKKFSLQHMIRAIAVLIFIVGAFMGYDMGDKMITVDQKVLYQFDLWLALLVWFLAFAAGMLFFSIAKIIDLLEKQQ